MKIKIKPNDQSWVGKLIRKSYWDESAFLEILYVGFENLFGRNRLGYENMWEISNDDWELYKTGEKYWFSVNDVLRSIHNIFDVLNSPIFVSRPHYTFHVSSIANDKVVLRPCDDIENTYCVKISDITPERFVKTECDECHLKEEQKRLKLNSDVRNSINSELFSLYQKHENEKNFNLLSPAWFGGYSKFIWPDLDANGKPIQKHENKKNLKLFSPAIWLGKTPALSQCLYSSKEDFESRNTDLDGVKYIWPALDANGNPIQYLIEENEAQKESK